MNIFLSPFAPENLVSRDWFGSPVPRQPAHLHTQAESGAYSHLNINHQMKYTIYRVQRKISTRLNILSIHFEEVKYCNIIFNRDHYGLKRNLNASRLSEHPPVRGENVTTFRWDHRLRRQILSMALKRVLLWYRSKIGSTV